MKATPRADPDEPPKVLLTFAYEDSVGAELTELTHPNNDGDLTYLLYRLGVYTDYDKCRTLRDVKNFLIKNLTTTRMK